MSQPISVSVSMDERSFRSFVLFDLFRHNKAWRRPAIFAGILLVCAGICLSQVGRREGAGLLAAVLALVALGVPAVYFGTFARNLSKQSQRLGLATPKPFYRVELGEAGLSVWMAGQQDKPQPTHQCSWAEFCCAYRTADAIYLYMRPNQAFALPGGGDAAWRLLSARLDAARLHDCR